MSAPTPQHASPHAHDDASPHAHRHGAGPAQHADLAEAILHQEFWDERYGGAEQVWSGDPNPQLVAEVADLPPGRALEVGCGEGADAVWLAARGWQVTGVDLSPVALARAEAAGRRAGPEVASRLRWQHADLVETAPELGAFDLVCVHFLHLPPAPRARALAGLAAAVAPGGTLLWVAHHPRDMELGESVHRTPELMPAPEEVAAELDPAVWELEVVEARPRLRTGPDGTELLHHDAVVRARKVPQAV